MTDVKRTVVYVARVVTDGVEKVFPPERNLLIEKTKNESLRRERYSVWRLLEYALSDAFDINIRDLSFRRTDGGKRMADGIFFSLSHTPELVCVAVSEEPVGVDIERVRETLSSRTAERILSESELEEYRALESEDCEEFIIRKWSGKEAMFKREELSAFVPHLYVPTKDNTAFYRLTEREDVYVISVTASSGAKLVDLRD